VSVFTCAAMILSGSSLAFAASDMTDSEQNAQSAESISSDLTGSGSDVIQTVDMPAGEQESPGNTDAETDTGSEQETDIMTPDTGFEKYTDVKSHWAKEALNKAYNDGIIKGFEDNTMRPDDRITGAQMITIITRVLNTSAKADTSDVSFPQDCWYTEEAAEALALGIIEKSDIAALNGKMVRKEACTMMSDAFQLENADPDMSKASQYKDFNSLTLSEKIIFASLVNNGYLQGWDGSLHLSNDITRAEFITLLYRAAGEYTEADQIKDYSALSAPTVLSAEDFSLRGETISENIWLDAGVKTVALNSVKAKSITVRSESLNSIKVKSSEIERLVLASRAGNVNFDCIGIGTTVVGDGEGSAYLSPAGNDIEITGDGRNVTLDQRAGSVSVSGNNNTVTLNSAADAEKVNVYGINNIIKIDSDVAKLNVDGRNNKISGRGRAETAVIGTATSSIEINVGELVDNVDYGIKDMIAAVNVPAKAEVGREFQATADLGKTAVGKTVTAEWTVDGKTVKTEQITLNENTKPVLNYSFAYSQNMPEKSNIGFVIKYTTKDGEYQTVSAPAVSMSIDKASAAYFEAVVAKVQTKYKGNFTTQWAIDHDLTNAEKEIFVNYKGYASSSQYLIWVNIGTQHTTVFQGSKGSWKLIRSGLVSTGAGDCTPRGVFKTTYKQTDWTTGSYTVKPIVRFYGGGYAMHSRLYYPNTTTLKGGNNGVGYPLSHGCVRMQADDIQWIYSNVPNGTTVVVY
ncbi:MAG: S-layer homology domain-containing protein, partial [Clostridiales bacterium]|nr:S-layer homology domain-containing protein [Clostridiales bacterium]